MVLHPVVANKAFRSIYCVRIAADAPFVLATELSRECFGPSHVGVFVLAVATIVVSLVGFPLFVMVMLSKSARWWEPICPCVAAPPPPPPASPPTANGGVEGDSAAEATHRGGEERGAAHSGARPPSTRLSALADEGERATAASGGVVATAPTKSRQSACVALSRRCGGAPPRAAAASRGAAALPNIRPLCAPYRSAPSPSPLRYGRSGKGVDLLFTESAGWAGPVSGGVCFRCAFCVACLQRSRSGFEGPFFTHFVCLLRRFFCLLSILVCSPIPIRRVAPRQG